jgi:protein SCO1/2
MENWVFLTSDAENIRRLTEAVGFRYKVDGDEFAHASALIILTPEGKFRGTSRVYNTSPAISGCLSSKRPGKDRLIRNVKQASAFCYEFDPVGKKYALKALNVVKAGGVVTLLSICGVLTYFWRRERNPNRNGGLKRHMTWIPR